MSSSLHPSEVLYSGEKPFPAIAACVHYAGRERYIQKALELQHEFGPIFDITCDCDDGAVAGAEREHAEMVSAFIAGPLNRHDRVGARIHDYTHRHWRDDLDIILRQSGTRIAFIVIPKVERVAQLAEMIEVVKSLSKQHCGERHIPIHVMVETHGALREINSIAALPDVETLDFGIMDFVSSHRGAIPVAAMRSPGQFDHPLIRRAKCEVVAAAIGHGVIPAHNVTTEVRDVSQVAADARRAREEFGFLRMWSIHPTQIEPIVKAMSPREDEADEAAEILIAAQEKKWGPIQVRGRLHDRASYRYYWDLLQRAKATGLKIPELVNRAFWGK
ncbi:MAG: CoA ester lyase [Candidatus Riflebacteria bacterium]|nr:CoA ester lyase [Candidatus Riflebacteria bacterium]